MFFLKIKILIQNTSFIFLYHFRLNFIGPIYIKFIICQNVKFKNTKNKKYYEL